MPVPPKPMRRIPKAPSVDVESVSKQPPPKPVIGKPPVQQETLQFDEPVPEKEQKKTPLEKKVDGYGEPYGMHSGKKRRGSHYTKNVEGEELSVSVDFRDTYAAFFHMTAASHHIDTVLTYFAGSPGLIPPEGVDIRAVENASKSVMQAVNSLFNALGMDKEHNIPFHVRRQDSFCKWGTQ